MFDRHIEPEIIPACAQNGLGITVFSPLAQGMLTGKYDDGIPAGSRAESSEGLANELSEQNLKKTRALSKVATGLGVTMSQLALAWILRRHEISCVITGATRPEQVIANVKAADLELEQSVLTEIEEIL